MKRWTLSTRGIGSASGLYVSRKVKVFTYYFINYFRSSLLT